MTAIRTQWLHDSQQLAGDIFACLAVDRNELLLIDVSGGNEIAGFDLSARGHNPQFLSVVER
jgi:hypothetical protein